MAASMTCARRALAVASTVRPCSAVANMPMRPAVVSLNSHRISACAWRSSLRCHATSPSSTPQPETSSSSSSSASEEVEEVDVTGTAPIIVVDDFEGLSPEEDLQVPGSYFDALNGNTKLGKAVRAACSELEHLNDMELQMMQQAEALLKKLGVKTPIVVPVEEEGEGEAEQPRA